MGRKEGGRRMGLEGENGRGGGMEEGLGREAWILGVCYLFDQECIRAIMVKAIN